MSGKNIDIITVALYLGVVLLVGLWSGKGRRKSSDDYFISKKSLPWWAIGAAYVATGLNSEQLVGMNGMSYKIGLPVLNSTLISIFVFTALIFFFFPLYLRNNIVTMPQYLGKRFDKKNQNVFTVLLLLSYIFINLAVVLYGGAKLFEVIFGVPLCIGVLILGVIAGVYTIYGGMSSMVSTSVLQFILMFVAGGILFTLGYLKLPNGWEDIIQKAPGGFHMMQSTDYPIMPWHAIVFSFFNLQLYYSCMNQALVQRGFGAKTEWDLRTAFVFVLIFALLRPFLEVFPGMIANALAQTGYPGFIISEEQIDEIYPILIENLVPNGLRGLILVGLLAAVMSTISAFLNSISTIFTYDVYKRWINKKADDKKLVKVGVISTFILMIFSVLYAPIIEKTGGIFIYFQSVSAYFAVPVATCFLFGMFWKRTTPAAALTVLIIGIPLGLLIQKLAIPLILSSDIIEKYSLTNFYVSSGITQVFCVLIIIVISLYTKPRREEEISSFTWTKKLLFPPPEEKKRSFWKSIGLWWTIMAVIYGILYYLMW